MQSQLARQIHVHLQLGGTGGVLFDVKEYAVRQIASRFDGEAVVLGTGMPVSLLPTASRSSPRCFWIATNRIDPHVPTPVRVTSAAPICAAWITVNWPALSPEQRAREDFILGQLRHAGQLKFRRIGDTRDAQGHGGVCRRGLGREIQGRIDLAGDIGAGKLIRPEEN